jgi:RNA polymerase sigma-70 factor, ECF subfamily
MNGTARELEALYETRYVSFRNALAMVTGSRESARDAVQEAFARALAGCEGRRPDGCLAAWVWKIAYRVALEQQRRDLAFAADEPGQQLLAPESDPQLEAAIRRLSPRRRLIVFLRYFGDFSYAEIAASCDVSEGTVAATLAQAHAELRAELEQEGAVR